MCERVRAAARGGSRWNGGLARAYKRGVLSRRSLLAGAAALACGRPAPPARPRLVEARDTVFDLIEAWRDKLPVAGVSVALVDRGELAWAVGAGTADREEGLSAAPETLYAIGSLTKPITAMTVLRAVAAGQLDLDAPLARHLPELRAGGAAAITARQLLCHRSGLVSDWHRGGLGERPPDWRLLAREVADEPLLAPPDSWTAYSNVGYTLLGLALERICGRPWSQLVDEAARAALGPVGLTFERPTRLAATYTRGVRGLEPRVRYAPAAGLYGSVLDLAALMRWLLAGEGAAAAMLTPQGAGPLDFDERWGLGLALQHNGLAYAGRVAWHTGRTYGHRGSLFLAPDRGLGVAVLANFREAGSVDDLAVAVMQTALLERDGLDLPRSRGDAEVPAPAPVDPAAARAIVGRYASDTDVFAVTVEEGRLSSRSGHGATALLPAPEGGFVSADEPEVRVQARELAGRRLLTATARGVEARIAVLCPEGPVSPDWLARLGVYRVDAAPDEVFTFDQIHLEVAEGVLQLRLEAPRLLPRTTTLARYALAPTDARTAVIFGVGRGKGQRVAAEDGPEGPTLRWSGCRLVRQKSVG